MTGTPGADRQLHLMVRVSSGVPSSTGGCRSGSRILAAGCSCLGSSCGPPDSDPKLSELRGLIQAAGVCGHVIGEAVFPYVLHGKCRETLVSVRRASSFRSRSQCDGLDGWTRWDRGGQDVGPYSPRRERTGRWLGEVPGADFQGRTFSLCRMVCQLFRSGACGGETSLGLNS